MSISKPQFNRILVATDLSENADHAFNYATSLADACAARITVLHVVEKLAPNAELLLAAYLEYGGVDELRQKNVGELVVQIKARLERFCAETAEHMAECRYIFQNVMVEPGKAAERILHHTATGAFDVLVMGRCGHGRIQEVLLGSTSHRVLRECRIPILLIPVGVL